MASADVYAEEIHKQLKRYATWLPTDYVSVGAVGQLQGKIFTPLSHLRNFGISVNVVNDPNTKATYKFTSGAKEAAIGALATGVPGGIGSAGLSIAFSKAHSVYFLLAKCVGHAIDNLKDLGDKVLKQVQRGQWQLDYVIVTRVVTAGSATILQAESKGASIDLEGDASGTPVADLLKAGASVKVKSQSSVGLSIVAESKLTPLLSLAKVKYTFLDHVLGSGPKFSYTLERNSAALRDFGSHVDRLTNVDFAKKETTKNDLLLNVRLPKYGTYVDIADLLDLTAKTSAVRRARAPGVRVVTATDFGFGTRVLNKQLRAVVDRLSFVDLDEKASEGEFIHLNIKLPKSGTSVSVEPLFKLAMNTAEPRAHAIMSADLSFAEIL
jgi:hypothetical protein